MRIKSFQSLRPTCLEDWSYMGTHGQVISHDQHIHGPPVTDLRRPKVDADQRSMQTRGRYRPKVDADQPHRFWRADAIKGCFPNNTAMTVLHMIELKINKNNLCLASDSVRLCPWWPAASWILWWTCTLRELGTVKRKSCLSMLESLLTLHSTPP